MAHFFFFDPYNLPYFYLQNLNVVRIKLGAFLQEILHSCLYKDPHTWRLWILSYQLKCTMIEHSKKRSTNLISMEGSAHISWEFWFHIVIVSSVHHVDSLPCLEKKKKKKSYQQTNKVQKTSTLWRALKNIRRMGWCFLVLCLRLRGQ